MLHVDCTVGLSGLKYIVQYNLSSGTTQKKTKDCFFKTDYCPIEIIKGLTDKGQFQ